MANVYSASLWVQGSTVGTVTGPTVPAGFVWVVRTITLFCTGNPLTAQGQVRIFASDGTAIAGWSRSQLYGGLSPSWDGHHVLNPGVQLGAQVSPPGAVQFALSGYQLTLP